MAGIRRRSALSEATTFVHVTLPAAYLQLDDVSGVYQEESVRIRPFDLGQSARAVSEWRVTRPDLISRRTSAPFWRYALLRHPTITTPAILAAWACPCLPSIGYDVGMQALRLVLATTVAFAAASAQPAVLGATSHTPCSLCAYRNSSDRRISRFNSSTLAHCLLDWRRAVSIDGMIPPWARRPHSAVQSV